MGGEDQPQRLGQKRIYFSGGCTIFLGEEGGTGPRSECANFLFCIFFQGEDPGGRGEGARIPSSPLDPPMHCESNSLG